MFFTGLEFEMKKIFLFWFIMFLSTSTGDLTGLVLSIIYPEDNLTAVVLGSFQGFRYNEI